MVNGIKLLGSLSIVDTAPVEMSATENDMTTTFEVATALRLNTMADSALANDDYAQATYYILVPHDLNKQITFAASETDDEKDDAYGMNGITVTNVTAGLKGGFELNLPIGNKTIKAGTITAKGGGSGGTFTVNLEVSIDEEGLLSTGADITGFDVVGTVEDDFALHQMAYWDTDKVVPSTSSSGADDLSATVTPISLTSNTAIAAKLLAIENLYNTHNVVASWSLTFDAVTSLNNGVLARYANSTGRVGLTDGAATVFAVGDRIIASGDGGLADGSSTYTVVLTDVDGEPQTLIGNTKIYGILQQS